MNSHDFPELENLLSCYFHQDWQIEYKDEDSAVKDFTAKNPKEYILQALAQLEKLLAYDFDEHTLEGILDDFSCDYYARPGKTTYRAFLTKIQKNLAQMLDETNLTQRKQTIFTEGNVLQTPKNHNLANSDSYTKSLRKLLMGLVVIFGIIGVGLYIRNYITHVAIADPTKCSFEEIEASAGYYRIVIPPNNQWYKSGYSLREKALFTIRIDENYDFTHTDTLFQSSVRSDTTGLLQVDYGKTITAEAAKIRGRGLTYSITKTGNVRYRYSGLGCIVIVVNVGR